MKPIKFPLWTVLISILFLSSRVIAQENPVYGHFLRNPPQLEAKIFAPGLISTPEAIEFGSVFSKDGKDFYYGYEKEGTTKIKHMRLENGEWSTPVSIIENEYYGYNDPFLSPDEDRLYYISDQPKSGKGDPVNHDIWYSTKTDSGWSKPINAGMEINSEASEYYISFTSDGKMYFSSDKKNNGSKQNNFDIYTSEFVDGQFKESIALSSSINTSFYEADVFVAPDETYLIFCSVRPQGKGRGDLYISFKVDGKWSEAQAMGDEINTDKHELCPFVTHDGKYFFFTRNNDIYWISASIIDNYRP